VRFRVTIDGKAYDRATQHIRAAGSITASLAAAGYQCGPFCGILAMRTVKSCHRICADGAYNVETAPR
jgi:hypothetical protein